MFQRHCSERGAVSVFLILIFAIVFAFVSIFIDFSRMAALQAKTEMLAHSASRSVMSAYDPSLLEKYGLFAFGETDANYIMSKVLQDQFEFVKHGDSLQISGARLDSSGVEMQRPLGTYAVFEQQIREQMKYKAPIDFTIEIVNRFKPLSRVMKEASNTVDLLGKLQKLYDLREAKLDELLETQRKAAGSAANIAPLIPRSGSSQGNGISTGADIAEQYPDYAQKVEEDRDREPLDKMYTMEIAHYRYGASEVFGKLAKRNEEAKNKHDQLLPQARKLLTEVKQINEQMKLVIEESERRPAQEGYDDVSAMQSTGTAEKEVGGEQIAEIRRKSRDLLLSEQLFADFEGDIGGQETKFESMHSAVNSFLVFEGPVMSVSSSSGELYSAIQRMNRETDAYLELFSDAGSRNLIEENQKILEAHRASDEERKRTEKEAEGKLKEAKSMIGRISDLQNKLKGLQRQFDQLEAFYKENREKNRQSGSGQEAGTAIAGNPYDAGGGAMGGMDILFGGFSSLIKGMSDNCFQTEYIANYFTYLDISALDELLDGSGTDKLDRLTDSLAAGQQEVEYILYGFHNPAGNIAAAYGEIFGMRLAIRTMEGLIKNSTKGHPLLILAAALLYGIEHAVKDMIELTKTGSLELSDYLKIKLSYRDHLRIFLLLHGRSEARLSRMLAVIRLNTGISTEERPTYLKGTVTVAMPVWFLPGVAKALGSAGILSGRVEGNTYVAVKQADFSY